MVRHVPFSQAPSEVPASRATTGAKDSIASPGTTMSGEAPPLAALQKPLTQFVLGAEQDDRKLERVLTRKAEHGCGADGSAAAGDYSGGEGAQPGARSN